MDNNSASMIIGNKIYQGLRERGFDIEDDIHDSEGTVLLYSEIYDMQLFIYQDLDNGEICVDYIMCGNCIKNTKIRNILSVIDRNHNHWLELKNTLTYQNDLCYTTIR